MREGRESPEILRRRIFHREWQLLGVRSRAALITSFPAPMTTTTADIEKEKEIDHLNGRSTFVAPELKWTNLLSEPMVMVCWTGISAVVKLLLLPAGDPFCCLVLSISGLVIGDGETTIESRRITSSSTCCWWRLSWALGSVIRLLLAKHIQ